RLTASSSFPTRRSSDLWAGRAGRIQEREGRASLRVILDVDHREVVLAAVEARVHLVCADREEIAGVVFAVPAHHLDAGRARAAQDRKSTRLNSSHGSIS